MILTAFACNDRQSKKAKDNPYEVTKPTSGKALIRKIDKAEQKVLKPCDSIVTEIVTTSPRYKKLTKGLYKAVVKNEGISFGISLDGSPNARKDNSLSYSKTYDFTLFEMYTDRKLNTARFSFNPNNKKLYEYDPVHNQLKSIKFDRNLLLKYNALCK